MKQYDVIVFGAGLSALTTASYLSKRCRNVALFVVDEDTKLAKATHRFMDKAKKTYRFDVPYHEIGGLGSGELISFYLARAGIDEKLKVIKNNTSLIIKEDGRMLSRPNDVKGFKVYLVRHYPKARNQIHRFFDDLEKHYNDFKTQRFNRLRGLPHTLNTLVAQWGNLSLQAVLSTYFKDENLIREFTFMHPTVGLEAEKIHAYPYFVRWFHVFMETSYFISHTYEELDKMFLSAAESVTVHEEPIEAVEIDGNRMVAVLTKDKKRYEAMYFCINEHPDTFVKRFVKEDKGFLSEQLPAMFKPIKQPRYKNTAMIGLDCPLTALGVLIPQILFDNKAQNDLSILSVIDYTHIHKKSAPQGHGAILVEYSYSKPVTEEMLIEALTRRVAKLNRHVAVVRFGGAVVFEGGYHADYKRFKSLDALKRYDRFEHLRLFENTWFIGTFSRPDGGALGLIQMGVEVGEIIDNTLETDELTLPALSHDTLINVFLSGCVKDAFEAEGVTIDIHVGKRAYSIDYRNHDRTVYEGPSDEAVLVLRAPTETFYKIAFEGLSLDRAVKEGKLESEGNQTVLKRLNDSCRFIVGETDSKPAMKPWGMVLFLLTVSFSALFSAVAMFERHWWVPMVFVALMGIKYAVQTKMLAKFVMFDLFVIGLGIVYLVLNLVLKGDLRLSPAWFVLGLSAGFIFWAFLTLPPVHETIGMDYAPVLRLSRYFRTMMSGLSIIWGLTFLLVFFMMQIFENENRLLGYHFVLLVGYLTFKYPKLYEQSKIRRRK